ncbi:hypothetical protein HK100_012400 [Physocladia obscura]|uniref:Rab3-GAP regulatory subunit N-terminal domain-containing protein n=1 Tax=Physocladia obscura TaxID=109957 RepID=A0AAD5SZT3_9FUNG|nr:hypothetical protein HK100_012400 [Physocladia obscura]
MPTDQHQVLLVANQNQNQNHKDPGTRLVLVSSSKASIELSDSVPVAVSLVHAVLVKVRINTEKQLDPVLLITAAVAPHLGSICIHLVSVSAVFSPTTGSKANIINGSEKVNSNSAKNKLYLDFLAQRDLSLAPVSAISVAPHDSLSSKLSSSPRIVVSFADATKNPFIFYSSATLNPSSFVSATICLSSNSAFPNVSSLLDASSAISGPIDQITLPQKQTTRFLRFGSDPFLSLLESLPLSESGLPKTSTSAINNTQSADNGDSLIVASVDRVATTVVSLFSSFTRRAGTALFNEIPSNLSTNPTSKLNPPPYHQQHQLQQEQQQSMHPLPSFLRLHDRGRRIIAASVSPCNDFVALLDSWGRILVFNARFCEIVFVLKGYRDAQFLWRRTTSTTKTGGVEPTRLCLVVFCVKSGSNSKYSESAVNRPNRVLEIWAAASSAAQLKNKHDYINNNRHGTFASSAFLSKIRVVSVGPAWILVTQPPVNVSVTTKVSTVEESSHVLLINHETMDIMRVSILGSHGNAGVAAVGGSGLDAYGVLMYVQRQIHALNDANEGFEKEVNKLCDYILIDVKNDVRLQAACIALLSSSKNPPIPLKSLHSLSAAVYSQTTAMLKFSALLTTDTLSLSIGVDGAGGGGTHTRPFCIALFDVWIVMAISQVCIALTQTSASNIYSGSSTVRDSSRTLTVAKEVFGVAETLIAKSQRVETSAFNQTAGVVDLFEPRFDEKRGRICVRLKKCFGIDGSGSRSVGRIFFVNLFNLGTVEVSGWIQRVFENSDGGGDVGKELFFPSDLMVLLIDWIESELGGWIGGIKRRLEILQELVGVLLTHDAEVGGVDESVLNVVLKYCWTCSHISIAYIFANILETTLATIPGIRNAQEIANDIENLVTKLKDCQILYETLDASAITTLTASTLDKTEKTSTPRFIALHQVILFCRRQLQSQDTNTASTVAATTVNTNQNHNDDEYLRILTAHFPASHFSTLIPIYKTRLHADAYLCTPNNAEIKNNKDTSKIRHLLESVDSARRITHPTLRNGTLVWLYRYVFAIALRAVIGAVDSGGSIDAINARVAKVFADRGCGEDVVIGFLDALEGAMMSVVCEDGCISVTDICDDFQEVLNGGSGGFSGVVIEADDAVGNVLSVLRGFSDGLQDYEISRDVVDEHIVLVRVLRIVFNGRAVSDDWRRGAVTQLFRKKVGFGKSLFVRRSEHWGWGSVGFKENFDCAEETDEWKRVLKQRKDFVTQRVGDGENPFGE